MPSDIPALLPRSVNVQPDAPRRCDAPQTGVGQGPTKTSAGIPTAAPHVGIAARAATFPPLPADAPLAQLYADLSALFARVKASSGERMDRHQSAASFAALDAGVRGLIGAYVAAGHDDWRGMAGWNPLHYVRHLVDANDDFELLLLCWQPGQESRCHNHQDSHGWVTVMEGVVEERRYAAGDPEDAPPLSASPPKRGGPGTVAAAKPCPKLEHLGTGRARPGDGPLHIHDGIGLHVVGCPRECPPPGACTLHLYSPPITRATLYDPEENKVVTRVPGYFSIRGHKA